MGNHSSGMNRSLTLDELAAQSRDNYVLYEEKSYILVANDIFRREVEEHRDLSTLFRGTTPAIRLISYSFRAYGKDFIKKILEPHIPTPSLLPYANTSYEIDPNRLDRFGDLKKNQEHLLKLSRRILDSIITSGDEFPKELNVMCIILRNVLSKRYPDSNSCLKAIGTLVFLRYINPALVSPVERGVVEKQPSTKAKRGLLLVSKILQNIANQVEFSKEAHMLPFNDFVKSKFSDVRAWVAQISSRRY